MAVTNMTAKISPLRAGKTCQGNMRRSPKSQVGVSPTAAGALNIQPWARASARRRSVQREGEMRRGNAGQQDGGQHEGTARAAQGEIERKGYGDGRGELGQVGPSRVSRSRAERVVRDDAHGAAHHQPAGRAEKAADHRIGDEADGAAGARQAEPAEQYAGQAP